MNTDFETCLPIFAMCAVKYSGLKRPPGENYKTITARIMGLSKEEADRVFSQGADNSRAWRVGYSMLDFALKRRGSLDNLPSFAELITEFPFQEWIDHMIASDRIEVLVELHADLQ